MDRVLAKTNEHVKPHPLTENRFSRPDDVRTYIIYGCKTYKIRWQYGGNIYSYLDPLGTPEKLLT